MGETADELLAQQQMQEVMRVQEQQEQAMAQAQQAPQEAVVQAPSVEQERVVEANVTENQALLDQVAVQMEPIAAQATAQGTPVQQQAPARMSRKERKAAERQAKQDRLNHARERIGPAADYLLVDEHTSTIADKLSMRQRSIRATSGTDKYRNTFHDADDRINFAMLQGHIMNEHGEPLNEEEAKKKAEDIQLMDDYKSKNIHRRRPIMMKYFKRLLDMKLDETLLKNMDDSAYLAENIAQLEQLSQDVAMFENTLRDPLNQMIFEELPEELRKFIKDKGDIGGQVTTKLIMSLSKRGLSGNKSADRTATNSDYLYIATPLDVLGPMLEGYQAFDEGPGVDLVTEVNKLPQMEKTAQAAYQKQRQTQQEQDLERIRGLPNGSNASIDRFSVGVYDKLKALQSERNLIDSIVGIQELSRDTNGDPRVLGLMFSQRFNIADLEKEGKQGDYARSMRDGNIQRIRDYASNDLEKRRPILDEVIEELLSYKFSVDMFTQGRLANNAAIYSEMGDKLTYYQNIRDDPINKPYFDALPPETLAYLNQKNKIMTSAFSSRLTSAARTKGVESNGMTLTPANMPREMIDMPNAEARASFAKAVDDLQKLEESFRR